MLHTQMQLAVKKKKKTQKFSIFLKMAAYAFVLKFQEKLPEKGPKMLTDFK